MKYVCTECVCLSLYGMKIDAKKQKKKSTQQMCSTNNGIVDIEELTNRIRAHKPHM